MKLYLISSLTAGAAALALSTGVLHSSPSQPPTQDYVPPVVFQAAGPSIASIQSMVDQFRAALGGINNGNVAGPLDSGRREINWDGGGSATSLATTPFAGFLINRGALFTTPGTGFVQAPVDGLVTTFSNADYATAFRAFSPVRLFAPIGSTQTHVQFFVPGGGNIPALTTGFGAIFSDVDLPDGSNLLDGARDAATSLRFYDVYGELLYSSTVPPSPGDASLSFFGVVFNDARIAHVKIYSGNLVLGPTAEGSYDAVVMDDFIYGEPKAVK